MRLHRSTAKSPSLPAPDAALGEPSRSRSPNSAPTPFSADVRARHSSRPPLLYRTLRGERRRKECWERNPPEQNSANTTIVKCDVTDLASVEALAQWVDSAFHRLDILVNNAGIAGPGGPLHQLPPADWDRIFNTNLRGAYYCIKSLAPLMIRSMIEYKVPSGHIINISSLAGKNALPNGAAYSASKWGLNGLTFSVAEELRAHNIRVSLICPGSVNTDFSEHVGKNAEKMLQASDVAHAVAMIVTQAPQSFASEILLRPTQKP